MNNEPGTQSCPHCGERVLAIATQCKHCHSTLIGASGSSSPVSDTGRVGFWGARARIGRFRYLAYNLGISLLILPLVVLGLILLGKGGAGVGAALLVVAEGFALVMGVLVCIRRLHDMNYSGWWTFCMLIPLGNIIFIVILMAVPGSPGPNRFGEAPAANSGWVIAGAICSLVSWAIFPALAILMAAAAGA